MYNILNNMIKRIKIRVLIEGPYKSGKTSVVYSVLKNNRRRFIKLSVLDLFSDPVVQTVFLLEKYIRNDFLIFLDDIDAIFPKKDVDYNIVESFLRKKPNVIATTRSIKDVNPLIVRYFSDVFKMEQPPSDKSYINVENISFENIGGLDVAKQSINLFASWCINNYTRINEWNIRPPSGAILFGPPGTGKTLLAKAAANECKCHFFSITIPDLLRCEVGESEKQLTRIFEEARANAPSMIFIDEIQALFGERADMKGDNNRLVVHLLAQLEIPSKRGPLFCLAATNSLKSVDKALLQPGRFEELINISFPNKSDREEIFRVSLQKIRHSDDINQNLSFLSTRTDGLSASDINGICQKAAILSLINDRDYVTLEDLNSSIKENSGTRIRTGTENVKIDKNMSFKI